MGSARYLADDEGWVPLQFIDDMDIGFDIQFFEGGDVWIEGATADPGDAQARAEAERIACA